MPNSKLKGLLIAMSLLLLSAPVTAQETSYTQHENLVYGEAHGIGLVMMGASAGGHLASLAAVTADEKTNVQAVAVFFPPTDFLNYGGRAADPHGDGQLGQLVRRLAFPDGATNKSEEQIKQQLTQISPAHLVTSKAPPFLLIHGDADIVVPLQQSEVMVTALKAQSVPAELVIKKGGGHAWPTLHEEVQLLADWFDKQLTAK